MDDVIDAVPTAASDFIPMSPKQQQYMHSLLRSKRNANFRLLKPEAEISKRDASAIIDFLSNKGGNRYTVNRLLVYIDPEEIPNLDGGHFVADSL